MGGGWHQVVTRFTLEVEGSEKPCFVGDPATRRNGRVAGTAVSFASGKALDGIAANRNSLALRQSPASSQSRR